MSFELTIAVKRDPLEGRNIGDLPMAPPASYTTLTLNGTFDGTASQAVLGTLSDLFGDGADSILVELKDIHADDAVSAQAFATGLMSLRKAGLHVQVAVREAALHARMSELADSRDWLLACADVDAAGARHAIHVDGPRAER